MWAELLGGVAQKEEMGEVRGATFPSCCASVDHDGKKPAWGSGTTANQREHTWALTELLNSRASLRCRNSSVKTLEMDQTDPLVGSAQKGVNLAQGRPKWRETESETEDEKGAKLGLFHPKTTWSSAGWATSAHQPPALPSLLCVGGGVRYPAGWTRPLTVRN